MSRAALAAVLAVLVLAGSLPAWADGPRPGHTLRAQDRSAPLDARSRAQSPRFPDPRASGPDPRVLGPDRSFYPDPRVTGPDRRFYPDPRLRFQDFSRDQGGRHDGRPDGHQHRGNRVIVVPGPSYVVQSPSCYVPGYWSYTWVPQVSYYNEWVPGQWSPGGFWIEGHYEPRSYTTGGSYQPIWVPERWAC
jgi:hypothetical protein